MPARLLLAALFAAVACRPPVLVEPGGPPVAPEPAVVAAESVVAAEPVLAAEPEPPPTWEWAVSVLPELAGHSEVDPADAALTRFLGWFADGRAPRVHLLFAGACHAIRGTIDSDGFHGGWRNQVTIVGGERRVTGMSLDITRGGVTESGPGGVIYRRDAKGRWQEVGGFGTGHFESIVDSPLRAADERSLTFGGYWYRLEPFCEHSESVAQTCTDGAQRRCERCTRVGLKPQAEGRGWALPRLKSGRVEPTPVDCAQPCPADEWTPRLPRLASVLAGRQFSGVLEGEGPVVFRSAKGCASERRRKRQAGPDSADDPNVASR